MWFYEKLQWSWSYGKSASKTSLCQEGAFWGEWAKVCRGNDESHSFVLPLHVFICEIVVKVPGSHYGEIEILNICFYLHPKSTLAKRKKNYKYFLNSSCQSLPYCLSSEPLNSLALDQYLEYPHRSTALEHSRCATVSTYSVSSRHF